MGQMHQNFAISVSLADRDLLHHVDVTDDLFVCISRVCVIFIYSHPSCTDLCYFKPRYLIKAFFISLMATSQYE